MLTPSASADVKCLEKRYNCKNDCICSHKTIYLNCFRCFRLVVAVANDGNQQKIVQTCEIATKRDERAQGSAYKISKIT